MKDQSIRLRLIVFSALFLGIFVIASAIGSYWLFQRHVERLLLVELTNHFEQLLSKISIDDGGHLMVETPLSDPRFEMAGGGLYWQIDQNGQTSLRSRSLWDETLVIPTPPVTLEENHAHVLQLSSGQEILALERLVTLEANDSSERNIVVTVGLDRNRVTNAVTGFARESILGFAAAFVLLFTCAACIVVLGLQPLARLRRDVGRLRLAETPRLSTDHPTEIQPLVDEVNALVEAREQQLAKARQRAGNLAHGFKTPLTVLTSVADEIQRRKLPRLATTISENAKAMSDLVDRELARSRAAAGNPDRSSNLREVAMRVSNVLQHTRGSDKLAWQIHIPADAVVGMDHVDLAELIGNLADNARKHARSVVRYRFESGMLTVEDDGRGVPPDKLKHIFSRGTKLDEQRVGQGIGLAIVGDLADAYGFDVNARRSELGGLAIDINLTTLIKITEPN